MKLLLIFFYIVVPFSIFNSCIDPKCRGVREVDVSTELLYAAKQLNINYCSLLRKSLNHDFESLKKISLLNFENDATFLHGSVLIDIIGILGEDKYVDILKGITSQEKKRIETYLMAGLHFPEQRKKYNDTWEVKEAFPILYAFLNTN